MDHKRQLKECAGDLGFDLVGIAPAERPLHTKFYTDWLTRGYHGELAYLSRPDAVARRCDPREALPGARSIVVVALNYNLHDDGPISDPSRPVIARYARGTDYHLLFEKRLGALSEFILEISGPNTKTRSYVDYGPVLEREGAQRAGLGWIGKNTVLINPNLGSYIFLGVILTDAEFEPDDAFVPDRCGTCDKCIVACPTGALVSPRTLDSRLCISYLTIELRGAIPIKLRPLIGNRVFGCDICQEVCPWNGEAPETSTPEFAPRDDVTGHELIEWLGMGEAEFTERFSDTPLARARRRGFLRNVAVALGNWGDARGVPALAAALADAEPLVRGHAAWALGAIGTQAAREALESRGREEGDAWVREEIDLALRQFQ